MARSLPNVKITISHGCRVFITGSDFPVIVGNQEVKTWALRCIEQDQIEKVTTKSGVRDMEFLRNDAAISSTQDLVVEVAHSADGIDSADLVDAEMEYAGMRYRIPDSKERLTAMAACLRNFEEDENPRYAEHLKLVTRCFPRSLEDVVLSETTASDELRDQLKTVNRAFAVLQDTKTAATLRSIGIEPAPAMPGTLANSPNEKIRKAYSYQIEYL